MKLTVKVILRLLPGVVIALILLEIAVTNELVHYGKSVQAIDLAINSLQEENEHIAQKIASASSFSAIEQKATMMGFVQASNLIVLGQEEFALKTNR